MYLMVTGVPATPSNDSLIDCGGSSVSNGGSLDFFFSPGGCSVWADRLFVSVPWTREDLSRLLCDNRHKRVISCAIC